MGLIQEPKKIPKNFRLTLFIFFQILWAVAIIAAAMASYTAVKDVIVGSSGRDFTDAYINQYSSIASKYFSQNGTIEQTTMGAMTAATAGIMWAIAIVLAGFWKEVWVLYRTDNEQIIKRKNKPILISLIVLAIVGTTVWGYQVADCIWINNFHYSFTWVDSNLPSYATTFDNTELAISKGISFANIWNVTVSTAAFNSLVIVMVIPSIIVSAKIYNDWRLSA